MQSIPEKYEHDFDRYDVELSSSGLSPNIARCRRYAVRIFLNFVDQTYTDDPFATPETFEHARRAFLADLRKQGINSNSASSYGSRVRLFGKFLGVAHGKRPIRLDSGTSSDSRTKPLDLDGEDRALLQKIDLADQDGLAGRQAAVLLLSAGGTSLRSTGAYCGVPHTTVTRWRRRYTEGGLAAFPEVLQWQKDNPSAAPNGEPHDSS